MFPWRPIRMVAAPPENVVTIRDLRDRKNDKALASGWRRLKAEKRTAKLPPPSKILHFQMIDANMRRLKRFKGVPVSRMCGHRLLKGWTRWMLRSHPYDLL